MSAVLVTGISELVTHDPQKASVRDLVTAVAEVGYTAKPSAI